MMKIKLSSQYVNKFALDKQISHVISIIFIYLNRRGDKNYEFA